MKIVSALELGSTKIAFAVAKLYRNDMIELVDFKSKKYQGLDKITVDDLEEAIVELIEESIGVQKYKPKTVNLGVPAKYFNIEYKEKEVVLRKGFLSKSNAIKKFAQIEVPDTMELTDTYQDIIILKDNKKSEVVKLVHSVSMMNYKFVESIGDILSNVPLEIDKAIASQQAFCEQAINYGNQQKSFFVIDVGGSITEIMAYNNGIPVSVFSLPIGGDIITENIASSLDINYENAERMKIQYEDEIEYMNTNTFLTERNLGKIISYFINEIIELIFLEINKRIKFTVSNIYLIGGGIAPFKAVKNLVAIYAGEDNPLVSVSTPNINGITHPKHASIYSLLISNK